jgi:tRNA 2-thiouridine synthesizing protein A
VRDFRGQAAGKAMVTRLVDLRGLKCPLPALLAKRNLERAELGSEIVVLADDPMAPVDIAHMCAQEGFEILASERNVDEVRLVLRRPQAREAGD